MPLTEKFIRESAMQNFLASILEIAVVTGPASIDKDTVHDDLVNFRRSTNLSKWIQKSREGDSVIGFVEGAISLSSSHSYTHVILLWEVNFNRDVILTTPLSISPSNGGDRRVRVKVTMKEVPF